MAPPLSPALIEALRNYDTCTVANAIEAFDVRLRNEGYTGLGIQCLFPRPQPMVGYAVTVRMKTSNPPTGASAYSDRTDWWNYIEQIPQPRILAIEDVDSKPGTGSLFGLTHVSIWMALGCVGAFTNGTVRDLPSIGNTAFHVYAQGTVPSHAYVHIVDVGQNVKIAGLEVSSGDLLHGDRHGIVSVPLDIAHRIPAAADESLSREQQIFRLCRTSECTPAKIRELLKSFNH